MGCINVRDGDGRLVIYKLDACGNPSEGAANMLVLDAVSRISWEDNVTDGDQVTERNFAGRKVYSDVGADELDYIAMSITLCGLNPSVDEFLMGSTAKTDGSDVVGFGRTDLSSTTAVALEVLVELDADACAGGATAAPVAGFFFPLVKNWRPSGGQELNGTDLLKPVFTGKGYKNANIFTGSPTDLSRWSTGPKHVAGTEWYTQYKFPGFTLPTADCEPVAFT